MQGHFVDHFIFLSNTPFSDIFEKKTQFEITKLAHVLNADKPLYRFFRVT